MQGLVGAKLCITTRGPSCVMIGDVELVLTDYVLNGSHCGVTRWYCWILIQVNDFGSSPWDKLLQGAQIAYGGSVLDRTEFRIGQNRKGQSIERVHQPNGGKGWRQSL